jgi:hypothetical protein
VGGVGHLLEFVAGTQYHFLVKGTGPGVRGSIQLNWRQV